MAEPASVIVSGLLYAKRLAADFRRGSSRYSSDPLIWKYSWCVLAGHAVTWLFLVTSGALGAITDVVEPLCWPFFEDCWRYRIPPSLLWPIRDGYLVLIVMAGIALWRGAPTRFWVLLGLANVWLFAVMSLDYRLRANELYMLFWLNLIFLLSPRLRWSIPILLVSFYFWAGRLKLNAEWVSGADLYYPLWWIPSEWTSAACIYVVILEMFLIWGLLLGGRGARLTTLGQLALFHMQSLSQIHWFYPLLMTTMLAWFLLAEANQTDGRDSLFTTFVTLRAPTSAYAVSLAFASCQVIPMLHGGDRVLTGQGRTIALHMFEARQQCEVTGVLRYANGARRTLDLKMLELPPRMICDPVVYFDRAQNLCRLGSASGTELDLRIDAKRTTDILSRRIVNVTQICSQGLSYRVLGNNEWMSSR